jgi:putative methionine-R-sulfoxide reductase with GAF domain
MVYDLAAKTRASLRFNCKKLYRNGSVYDLTAIDNVEDVHADPSYLTALGDTRSEIIVPIMNNQELVVGTIDIESEQLNAFDQEPERVLEACAILLRPLCSER